MSSFISENFLLQSDTARKLYFDHVHNLPIADYHNHLPPAEIAQNKRFENLTEIWLKGDHYKWRAMRANGIGEFLITGEADDEAKFKAWAATVPYTVRNPLYHWTHMELKYPFGIDELLNEESADRIYKQCNDLLQSKYSVLEILKYHKVQWLCTTDNVVDDLQYHKQIKQTNTDIKVYPAFRPDPLLNFFDVEQWMEQIESLSSVSNIMIKDLDSFLEACQSRINYFHENGCRLSDHGLEYMPLYEGRTTEMETAFKELLQHKSADDFVVDSLQGYVLFELCKMYYEKQWAQQFHLGALRNNNSRLLYALGKDAGVDSIGDFPQAERLSVFLNALDEEEKLTKTILYNLNPSDNEVFATMGGNFQEGPEHGKIQWGSAWWFLDQKDGMEKQINALSNMGLLSRFVGMVTDSRSFLSFTRHDYFRRILCNLLGNDIEAGLIPNDTGWIGKMAADICFHNANNYFNFTKEQVEVFTVDK